MSARHHKPKILKLDKTAVSQSKMSSGNGDLVKMLFEHFRAQGLDNSQALERVKTSLNPLSNNSNLVTMPQLSKIAYGRIGKMVAVKERKPKHRANGRGPHNRSNLAWPKGDSYEAIFGRAIRRWRETILKIESIPVAAQEFGLKYQVWNRLEKGIFPQSVLKHANRFRELSGLDPIQFLALGSDEEPEA